MLLNYNAESICASSALGIANTDVPSAVEASRIGSAFSEIDDIAHPYAEHVNPYVARLLRLLNLDKTYVQGQGCRLQDSEGREYLDCIAAYGALPLGSNPAEIWQAIVDVRILGQPSLVQPSMLQAAGELAAELIRVAPGDLQYVTFANSGAEAIEATIKMCRAAKGRPGIVAMHNSFHGKTLGALSATGNPSYQSGFDAPIEHVTHVPFGDIDALRRVLEAGADQIAAVLIEPIQGEGGIIEPDVDYLPAVRKLCDAFDVLLAVDEIQTGLGRTGHLFACEASGVEPDVMTLAKALGGGLMPIGAVLANAKAYTEHFALKHSSTFAGNTLAARAGLAILDVLNRNDQRLVDTVRRNGRLLKARLIELQQRHPKLIRSVRGRGYLLGIELRSDRSVWPGSLLGIAADQSLLSPLFASYLLNVEGIRVAPTLNGKSVIRIEPPLTMSWNECEQLLSGLEHALEVFETGNTGQIISSILREGHVPAPKHFLDDNHEDPVAVSARPGERRFAFLLHPLDLKGAGDFDPKLAWVDQAELEGIAARLTQLVEPFVLSHTRVESDAGETCYGEFIVVPRTAEQLTQMPGHESTAIVKRAVELASHRGAQMVGLGAFTSVVTRGGKSLSGMVPLTTGNSYTAVACAEGIAMGMERFGDRLRATHCAAIVGATGAIGRSMAVLLAEDVGRLVLLGNPASDPHQVRHRLKNVARTICEQVALGEDDSSNAETGSLRQVVLDSVNACDCPDEEFFLRLVQQLENEQRLVLTQDLSLLPGADVVVTATSAPNSLLGPRDLKHGAVVCDLSRPFNISRDVADLRPDVLVIDGGVIRVPGLPQLGRFGMDKGHAFSCMAETMLLTLEGQFQDTSLGADLVPETLLRLRDSASKHGFRVGGLRRFGVPLTDADWKRLSQARGSDILRLPSLNTPPIIGSLLS